jgi:hypothetical protein
MAFLSGKQARPLPDGFPPETLTPMHRLNRHTAGAALVSMAMLSMGCAGGNHHKGERRISLLGSYGHPIKGQAIWPDGEGRAENAGLAVGYDHFVADRFSLGAALTPYRIYNQPSGDTYAGEFQIALRYYFAEFELLDAPSGLYLEALGGLMQSARDVPDGGSHTNFTQDSGLGLEVKLADRLSWVTGYRLRHLSNGDAFGEGNPSQNDHQVYTGLSISW